MKNIDLQIDSYCVYKFHGVGKIKDIQEITIGHYKTKCFIVYFENEKLTLSIPQNQLDKGDLRHLSSPEIMEEVFFILRNGTTKIKGMWSRRAKEYEEKINSGDITLVTEVLRDLTRDIDNADRSYSERIIYETALYRLSSEYAAINNLDYEIAKTKILEISKEKIKFVETSELTKVEVA